MIQSMRYEYIKEGRFLSRPNRFIAHVEIDGQDTICHVKNTGRCRELLTPGASVFLEYHPKAAMAGRKTSYDLVAVRKGELLINMDSQAPNQAAWEWIHRVPFLEASGGVRTADSTGSGRYAADSADSGPRLVPTDIRREVTHGDSRFDLAFLLKDPAGKLPDRPAFMEVKGVTLEEDRLALFPDAPTERGVKHLRGLIRAREEGFETYVLFLIQMKGIRAFSPNDRTHPAFGEALRDANKAGVHILALDCLVTPEGMTAGEPIPVRL